MWYIERLSFFTINSGNCEISLNSINSGMNSRLSITSLNVSRSNDSNSFFTRHFGNC